MSVVIFRRSGALPETPIVSKKEQAFKLFDQGKTLDDPEVAALGLAPESLKKYYRLWKNK